jgi:hypothetical protein
MNLMSADSDNVANLFFGIHGLWVAPCMIGTCLYFLHGLVGNAAFIGLAAMLLLVPVMAVFMVRASTKERGGARARARERDHDQGLFIVISSANSRPCSVVFVGVGVQG